MIGWLFCLCFFLFSTIVNFQFSFLFTDIEETEAAVSHMQGDHPVEKEAAVSHRQGDHPVSSKSSNEAGENLSCMRDIMLLSLK